MEPALARNFASASLIPLPCRSRVVSVWIKMMEFKMFCRNRLFIRLDCFSARRSPISLRQYECRSLVDPKKWVSESKWSGWRCLYGRWFVWLGCFSAHRPQILLLQYEWRCLGDSATWVSDTKWSECWHIFRQRTLLTWFFLSASAKYLAPSASIQLQRRSKIVSVWTGSEDEICVWWGRSLVLLDWFWAHQLHNSLLRRLSRCGPNTE